MLARNKDVVALSGSCSEMGADQGLDERDQEDRKVVDCKDALEVNREGGSSFKFQNRKKRIRTLRGGRLTLDVLIPEPSRQLLARPLKGRAESLGGLACQAQVHLGSGTW